MDVAGWRPWGRFTLALGAGAATALAQAPLNQAWLMILGFAGLWLVADAARRRTRPGRAAFAAGWFFGVGQFSVGLYWIAFAFLVDASVVPLIPFAMSLLVGGLALFPAAALWIWAWAAGRTGGVFILALAIFAAEAARSSFFGGFPWNLHGLSWGADSPIAQTVSVFGVQGLTLLTLLAAAGIARVLVDGSPIRRAAGPLGAAACFAALTLWGYGRLADHPTEWTDARVRIVHPSVPQRLKWEPSETAGFFRRHLSLSAPPDGQPVDYVVWPESATAFPLGRSADGQRALADAARGAVVIAGSVRWGVGERPHNSAFIFDTREGAPRIAAIYDKARLVPFVEYFPFYGLMRAVGLNRLSPVGDGFAPGEGPTRVEVGSGGAFAPLICYEILFSRAVPSGSQRPDWIVNITNDGWFGRTTGPAQHAEQARFRAIELGLPVARAANNGVSAVIDPFGRELIAARGREPRAIDSRVPAAIPPTAFHRIGDFGVWVLAAALAAALTALKRLERL